MGVSERGCDWLDPAVRQSLGAGLNISSNQQDEIIQEVCLILVPIKPHFIRVVSVTTQTEEIDTGESHGRD